MRRARFWFLILGTLLILCQSAFSAQVWTEQKITTTGTWSRGTPEIWGNEVYYADTRSGPGQIYAWDQAGGERLLLGGTEYRSLAGVYGDQLAVYHVNMNTSQYSLYLYDPVNGERLISATAGDISHPHAAAIYGSTVVWEDMRSGVEQVYSWDPVNGERHVAPTNYDQTNPRIWGNTVVWEDARGGSSSSDIQAHSLSLTDGIDHSMGGFNSPAIYQNQVFMFKYDPQYLPSDPHYRNGIWRLDLTTGLHTYLKSAPYTWQGLGGAQAWGNLYVWASGGSDAWDPVNGLTQYRQATAGFSSGPSIYGYQVAWSDGQNIYVDTFVPEPSGICALVLGLVGMCGSILRSKKRRSSGPTPTLSWKQQ